jgi:8-oxo-dGTP pyrophosphatase MutT (NUDIX family)
MKTKDDRTKQVLCMIYRIKDSIPQYLLLKRIPKKGAFWQPVCGGVEKNEELLIACFREMREEVSIGAENIKTIHLDLFKFTMDKHYISNEPIAPITESCLGFEIRKGVKADITNNIYPEHEKFEWFEFDQAIEKLKWKENKIAFNILNERLNEVKNDK